MDEKKKRDTDKNLVRTGRPPLPAELKKAKVLNKIELELVLNKYIYMKESKLEKLSKRKSLPAIDKIVIKMVERSIKTGDYKLFDFILDRLIGKVVENVNVNASLHATLVGAIAHYSREKEEEKLKTIEIK